MTYWEISVGEPWNFDGPDGQGRVLVEPSGFVRVAHDPVEGRKALLLRVQHPFTWEQESVEYLVAIPRYTGDTADILAERGGTVMASRVRAGVSTDLTVFEPEQLHYFMIGGLQLRNRTEKEA